MIGGPRSDVQSLRTASTDDVVQRWRPRQAVVHVPQEPIFPRAQWPFIRATQDKRSDVPIELANVD